jgi:hypothetical protein
VRGNTLEKEVLIGSMAKRTERVRTKGDERREGMVWNVDAGVVLTEARLGMYGTLTRELER